MSLRVATLLEARSNLSSRSSNTIISEVINPTPYTMVLIQPGTGVLSQTTKIPDMERKINENFDRIALLNNERYKGLWKSKDGANWESQETYYLSNRVTRDNCLFICLAQNTRKDPIENATIYPSTMSDFFGSNNNNVELGTNFIVTRSGTIIAIKYPKIAGTTFANRTVKIWSTTADPEDFNDPGTGTLLSTGTINSDEESSNGFVTVYLNPPVTLSPDVVYMASYPTKSRTYVDCLENSETEFSDTLNTGLIIPLKSGWSGVVDQFPTTLNNYHKYYIDIIFKSVNVDWFQITGQSTLFGDVVTENNLTTVNTIGGGLLKCEDISRSVIETVTATKNNTASKIVKRDIAGDFSAGTITANLIGNVIGNVIGVASNSALADFATLSQTCNVIPNLSGNVFNTGNVITVLNVGGSSAANINSAEIKANASTPSNNFGKIVARDATGNFSANNITANLTGNVTGNATTSNYSSTSALATNVTNIPSIGGDVSNTGNNIYVITVGGSFASDINNATIRANNATSTNIASRIVSRDVSGNFSASTITAGTFVGALSGNATTATTSTNFTGFLAGDIIGGQSSTQVAFVGGSSAANINNAEIKANSSTGSNVINTIVVRDNLGNFSASNITSNLLGNITGDLGTLKNIKTNNISGASANLTDMVVNNITGSTSHFTNINAGNLVFTDATCANFKVNNFTGANAFINNLNFSDAVGTNFKATNITGTNVFMSNAIFSTLAFTSATGIDLKSSNFTGSNAFITNLGFTNATGTNFRSTNFTGANAYVTTLGFTNANGTNLTITSITGTNAYFNNLGTNLTSLPDSNYPVPLHIDKFGNIGITTPSIYGSGTNGALTLSTSLTLTSDQYYTNLTINSGGILYTNGYRVFVNNILAFNGGYIHCNGAVFSANGGSGYSFVAGQTAGSIGGSGSSDNSIASNTLNTTKNTRYSIGGNGGSVGMSNNGGQILGTGIGGGGIASKVNPSMIYTYPNYVNGTINGNKITGGAGGAGCGDQGGSGAGGGVVIVIAKIVTGTANIYANGGQYNQWYTNVGYGGPGGGGAIILVTTSASKGNFTNNLQAYAGGIEYGTSAMTNASTYPEDGSIYIIYHND